MFVLFVVSLSRVQIASRSLRRKELAIDKKLLLLLLFSETTLGRSCGGSERVIASKTVDNLKALKKD